MKPSSLTWQQVALAAIMCTAIIVSHVVAPPVVGAITSIASTLIGVFFVNRSSGRDEEKPDEKPAPVLSLVKKDEEADKEGGS